MTRFLGSLLVIFALTLSAFGQEKGEKHGMVWFYFDGAKKCSVEWDQAITARKEAFAYLAKKIAEGDQNKIKKAMLDAQYSKPSVSLAWACGSDYSRNLENYAGGALIASESSQTGQMTEAEYDEAMTLVKTLRAKISGRPLTAEQKKLWAEAIKTIGADPESIWYKFNE